MKNMNIAYGSRLHMKNKNNANKTLHIKIRTWTTIITAAASKLPLKLISFNSHLNQMGCRVGTGWAGARAGEGGGQAARDGGGGMRACVCEREGVVRSEHVVDGWAVGFG
jgi:hypothetical protein